DEIKRERTGLAANLLPIPMFRPQNTGRQWTVPGVHVVVETDGAAPEDVQVTTDSLLASEHTDPVVTLPGAAALPRWLHDYLAADARVALTEDAPATGYPSPVTGRVSAGLELDRAAVGRALEAVREGGGVRAEVAPGRHLTVETTRAVLRRAHATAEGTVPAPVAVSPESLGVIPAVFHVTAQGMIAL